MKFLWMRTAVPLGGFAGAALVVWLVFGYGWALGVLCAGLAAVLARHLVNLRALVLWLRNPLVTAVPIGSGAWEQVFSQLYRFMRGMTQHQHRLMVEFARFRSAGQAMPDGVIGLDRQNHIRWCNAT